MALKGLFQHQRGCTPLRPCTSCEALAFLKAKLEPDTFDEFCRIAVGTREPKAQRGMGGSRSSTRGATPSNAKLDDVLTLSAEALSALKKGGVKTMGELLKHTDGELRSMGIDGRAVRGLASQLGKLGLALKPE